MMSHVHRYRLVVAFFSIALFCIAAFSKAATTNPSVLVYPAPSGEPLSSQFTVKAENTDVPVYLARINSQTPEEREKIKMPEIAGTSETSFASFDLSGSVQIVVTSAQLLQSVKVLPSSSGIVPTIAGNEIRFTVGKPQQLTLEINGDWIHALHLFANPMETDVPRPDDPNVMYFGPGIHEIDSQHIPPGTTVYVAGGAVVYGKADAKKGDGALFGLGGSNITLRGRGVIDGSRMARGTGGTEYAQGKNITIEGVVLRDSAGWSCVVAKCDNVRIQNVKIFGWRGNSDGIDICNSRHVVVSNCFLRTFDDLVVIKTNDDKGGPSQDISVKHCVLWNEFAHALSLGAEMREPVENVTFSDCDIIHDKGREWDLRVYHCDSGAIKNIVFDNIRIEESRRLFSAWIGKAMWSKDADRGHVDDVTFRNITSVTPTRPNAMPAELVGADADHTINGVTFDHVLVDGKPFAIDQVKQNAFVQHVTVTP